MKNNHIINHILSEKEYNQYARHIILEKISFQGQQKLKAAKILFIGAGGLACPCLIYLAACGIGNIGIIDNDTISISNLHRQILYNQYDLNKLKTETAKRKIQETNPNCNVNIYSYKLNYGNSFNLIKNYDIIIDTSDNFSTRYIIDEICYQLHKIHIYGAIQQFEGQMSVFNYQGGPKYSDLYPKHLKLDEETCNSVGVLNVLPGIIGILQATETIKIITGFGNVLSGHMLIYNAEEMSFKKVKILAIKKYDQELNNTKKSDNIIGYKELINKNINELSFIDVRQNTEFQQKKINNALNIPLKEISYKSNIDFLKRELKQKILIIYCSNNSRAIIASNILNKYKIRHWRLKNGLNDWINNQ